MGRFLTLSRSNIYLTINRLNNSYIILEHQRIWIFSGFFVLFFYCTLKTH